MSIKEFALILGISVTSWFISVFIQGILGTFFSFDSFGSCQVTGYPIAVCINSYNGLPIGYYFINIVFWFLTILGIWKFLLNRPKKSSRK